MKSFFLILPFLLFKVYLNAQNPNIILVIADDLGIDYMNGYHNSNLMPTTPNLDSIRANGITFKNVFATPKCTPSRATIMSGKHGVKTGVQGTPGHLDTVHTSIFKAIEQHTNNLYNDAVIGKWHVSHPADANHPHDHNIDYYSGLLTAFPTNYSSWQHTTNGTTVTDTNYATISITNKAIDWVNNQTQPWFLWLAHLAPHAPFHIPPDSLYNINSTGTNKRQYIAMIESIDTELGRLLNSMSSTERANTVIIFIGDNGSPNTVLQNYPINHGKGTLYQGGIHVPMFISGYGVTRHGEEENAMIHITDLYATILEITGSNLPGGIYNSLSFKHLLNNTQGSVRDYNYSETVEDTINEYVIRNNQYKLKVSLSNGTEEFYDLLTDSLEINDLILQGLTAQQDSIKQDLINEANQRRNAWSCRDHIQNGDEEGIDCGGTYCTPCLPNSIENSEITDNIEIYPIPCQNILAVKSETDNIHIKIYSTTGVIVLEKSIYKTNTSIKLKQFKSGVYIAKFYDEKGAFISSKKIIKN